MCTPFADFINEINNKKVYNAEDVDVVNLMYNLMQYSDNYSKILGSL